MASRTMMTGMRGVFLIAAELASRGLIVSLTSRSALGADLLATDPLCRKAYSVQVKTNTRTFSHWLLNTRARKVKSRNHIYVLVNLRRSGNEFFVVPSETLARNVTVTKKSKTRKFIWHAINRDRIERYRDKWSAFKLPAA